MALPFNLLAVLSVVVTNMIIGALWYSPFLFGNSWMKLVGLTEAKIKESGSAPKAMAFSAVLSFVIGAVLDMFMRRTSIDTPLEGMWFALWFWVIAAAVYVIHGLFENRPIKLYVICMAHELVAFAVAGLVLGFWRS